MWTRVSQEMPAYLAEQEGELPFMSIRHLLRPLSLSHLIVLSIYCLRSLVYPLKLVALVEYYNSLPNIACYKCKIVVHKISIYDQKISSHGVGSLTASLRISLARCFRMGSLNLVFDSFFFLGAVGGFIFLLYRSSHLNCSKYGSLFITSKS